MDYATALRTLGYSSKQPNTSLIEGAKRLAGKDQAIRSAVSNRLPGNPVPSIGKNLFTSITNNISAGENLMSPGSYGYASSLLDGVRGQPNLSLIEGAKRLAANEAPYRTVDRAFQNGFTARTGPGPQDPLPGSYVPAGERSYQQEVSRTAQLTAQDPELQRYENARKIAAAQGATPESVKTAEDIGMQIFAKKYGGPGGLASKVKPGQAGYEAIQGVLAPGRGMPGSTSLYKGAFPGDDYRDYGEPPTGAAAIPGFNTPAITGVAAQTVVPQLDPAQMKAQDLVESFKKGVFDPDLMEQIASSIYNR